MSDNSIHIEIDSSELDKFVEDLTQIPNDPKLRSNIGKALSHALEESTDWAFKNESDPNTGAHWKAWSERYEKHVRKLAAAKANKHKKSKKAKDITPAEAAVHAMLQLRGMKGGGLRSTIQEKSGDGEASISAGLGSNLRYARIHQLGGLTGRGHKAKIPARSYLGLTQQQKTKAAAKIGKLPVKAINDLGKR